MKVRTLLISTAVLMAAFAAQAEANKKNAQVELGEYLVKTKGCDDCHTPLKVGANGPEPDMSRRLSGHPETLVMPPAPVLPEGPWQVVVSGTNTAWAGPWGVSFTANITSDPETGIGSWTEKQFIDTMKTGRHLGIGRPILPPMPYWMIGSAKDEEIKAIFAYLKSTTPNRNKVPQPIEPAPAT